MNAHISEIMSSIQGEGTKIGCRQVFIRFAGCNLQCNYCDTLNSLSKTECCKVEEVPGSHEFVYYKNPINISNLTKIISAFNLNYHHSISLTGGEPLLHCSFIKEIIPQILKIAPKLKIFLETNGTLTDKLIEVIDLIDIISMDLKIPSTSKIKPIWDMHREFLAVAAKKEVYTKVVISNDTTIEEIKTISDIIRSVNSKIPLILQPQTIIASEVNINIKPEKIILLQEEAQKHLDEVRVIPQTHLFLGLL